MAWIKFKEDFDFSPAEKNGLVTIAYKSGSIVNVTTECCDLAIEQGKAVKTSAPKKDTSPDDE